MAAEKLYGEDIVDGLEDENAKSFRKQCNCLPSCTSISYKVIDRIQTFGQDHTIGTKTSLFVSFLILIHLKKSSELFLIKFSTFLALPFSLKLMKWLHSNALNYTLSQISLRLVVVCLGYFWEFPHSVSLNSCIISHFVHSVIYADGI